jgi:hypothetical protein
MPEKLSLIHLAALRLERQYRFYYWDHVVHLKGFRNHPLVCSPILTAPSPVKSICSHTLAYIPTNFF